MLNDDLGLETNPHAKILESDLKRLNPEDEVEKTGYEHLRPLEIAQTKDLENNTKLRTNFASHVKWLAYGSAAFWVFVTLTILFCPKYYGVISDAKYIALTTGATANILGAFLVAVKGLFNAQ